MLLVIQLSRKFGTGEQNELIDIFPNVYMPSDRVSVFTCWKLSNTAWSDMTKLEAAMQVLIKFIRRTE